MDAELPDTFKFDVEGVIAEALEYDLPRALSVMQVGLYESQCGGVMKGVADLIVPNTDSLSQSRKYTAFCGPGAVICAAFLESDAPKNLLRPTLSHFALRYIPFSLLDKNPGETLDEVETFALSGHAAHPEFGDTTQRLMEHYKAVGEQAELGRLAFCGAGFAIYQIDESWRHARQLALDKICRNAVESMDWDSLLG